MAAVDPAMLPLDGPMVTGPPFLLGLFQFVSETGLDVGIQPFLVVLDGQDIMATRKGSLPMFAHTFRKRA
jgi:hypothetical protein